MDEALLRALARLVAEEVSRQLSLVPAQGALPAHDGQEAGRTLFRREGDFWTLAYEDRLVRVRDIRGLHHLARLLGVPNRPVHVLDLATGSATRPGGGGVELLDPHAVAAYRRRLAELEQEHDAAERDGDEGRRVRAQQERDFLLAELSRALGLGGRRRTAGSPTERARVCVTKSVRSALAAVEEHHRALGEHLRRTVRTGTFCTYACERPPAWEC